MVFYTVIMDTIELNVSWMLIGQDLKRTGVHYRLLCLCWKESSLMEE